MIERVTGWIGAVDAWSQRRRPTRVTREAIVGFLSHEGLQYAGAMAYFSVLSLFQLLVLAVVALSFVLEEDEARQLVIDRVTAVTPLSPELVGGVIDSVISARGGMTLLSLVFLVWAALGFFGALSNSVNRLFENAPPRPFLQEKLLALTLMGLSGLLVVASVAIGIVAGVLQDIAADVVNGAREGEVLLWLIGAIVPVVLIFVAFWLLYKMVPNRPVAWGAALPGAIVATVLWTVLRFGFTFYVTRVTDYGSGFGAISTAITLLIFLYFAGAVVLLGAEFARAAALDR